MQMTPQMMAAVTLANNMNNRSNLNLDLQMITVPTDDWTYELLVWDVNGDRWGHIQCMFCPITNTTTTGIVTHIGHAHHPRKFEMVMVPPADRPLFMHCRRCDYITVDRMSVWIHFGIHHGLPNIVSRVSPADINPRLPQGTAAAAGKFLMYNCSYGQCNERYATFDSMIQHVKGVHNAGTVLCPRMCCQVTIVGIGNQGVLVESLNDDI
jgi:hypothetical protein